jgi:hypothetical protein
MFQMNIKYTNILHSKAVRDMHTQIGIFGMQTYHLVTLDDESVHW